MCSCVFDGNDDDNAYSIVVVGLLRSYSINTWFESIHTLCAKYNILVSINIYNIYIYKTTQRIFNIVNLTCM